MVGLTYQSSDLEFYKKEWYIHVTVLNFLLLISLCSHLLPTRHHQAAYSRPLQ